ncbi:MAG TPA: hypothetical protein VG841_14460 [Caulobacterales bacterium]|nr:hypothetical protein [Caulobacterales bacterium]
MPQPVLAILSQQGELAAKARTHIGDVNEAGLLVGRVISRAFLKFELEQSDEDIPSAMRRDLDSMLEQRLAS